MVRFQTLTRNLFLTLHGHNIHRQQQQQSMFLMRYQQFASHAYCGCRGAAGSVSKMASQQEKAFCVLCFDVSRSVITVQRELRAWFRKDAPPPFSQECVGASQSCSSTALDRTCCKRRQPPSPLATPFTVSNTTQFLSLGVC